MTIFHDVPGFEDYYQITDDGRIRTKPRYANSPICGGERLIPPRWVNVHLVKGYPAFTAFVRGKKHTVYIHRVMAMLFVPNPHGKPNINHKDGNKANFASWNLEWCTHAENMRHAFDTGLATAPASGPGEASPAAKLNDVKVAEIKRRLRAGERAIALAREYGVVKGTIGGIARGETWKHIP
jgi:hypothetical protein